MELSVAFAANLKAARKNMNLTQKELAQKIDYSEKAISKWECGGAIPPVTELVRLAAALHTTIDVLLSAPTEITHYLGIDGGGTKTAFLLENEQGEAVAEATLGSTNPNDVGFERCFAILEEGIAEVTEGIDRSHIAVFAGIAGGGLSGKNVELIAQKLSSLGFGFFCNGSDVENALEVALHGENGVAVIAGTGTIAFAQENGTRHRVAGWGYLFDGGGSGFDIARDAFEACYRDVDGRGGHTAMTAAFEKKLGSSLPDAIPSLYAGGKRLVASFAPLVFEAARNGDPTALLIVERNAACLARIVATAHAHLRDKSAPAVICGGIAHQKDLITPIIKQHLPVDLDVVFSDTPMVNGAVAYARRKYHEQH